MLLSPPLLLMVATGTALVAGVVNTIAGGGSFAVIAALVFCGMDPTVVNGTLRIGILVQTVVATLTFARSGGLDTKTTAWLAPATCIGGALGIFGGIRIQRALLRPLFGGLLVAWALLMTVTPAGFRPREDTEARPVSLRTQLMILLACAYGGLLQAGAGFPLLAILIVHLRRDPVQANGIKVALMAAYTMLALPGYQWAGLVDWQVGSGLAAGSVLGGYLGAKLQLSHGARLIRWIFAFMLAISGLLMLLG